MKTWVFEPREPLVLRDGRTAGAGINMRTLRFPWPSSLAGLVRTRIGQNEDGKFDLKAEDAHKLLEVTVKGPWLVEFELGSPKLTDRKVKRQFLPAPSDTLWHREDAAPSKRVLRRLGPSTVPAGASSDLPEGLELVLPRSPDVPAAKADRAPAFFSWEAMSAWLERPQDRMEWDEQAGLDALPIEERVHVAIDPASCTAAEGQLFGCEGVSFVRRDRSGGSDRIRSFALALACDDPRLAAKRGPGHLGGERRIGHFRPVAQAFPECISIPGNARRLRLILVTPGLFGDGYKPVDGVFGGEARVVAAAVGRPQVISGWDFSAGEPKRSRRMAPAGSVYWVELAPGVDPQAFARKWWFSSLCDEAQDARDGFGLAVVGVQ